MMLIKIYEQDGKLAFAGWVPEESVKIDRGINRPSTATIDMSITDLASWLAVREPVEPGPTSFWPSA